MILQRKTTFQQYFWIFSLSYLILGFFNILFAWLGLICLFIPIIIAVKYGNKTFCNYYCGRGQLLEKIGKIYSRNKTMPRFLVSKKFRYAFMVFFFSMFFNMLYITHLVATKQKELSLSIDILWSFSIPWEFAYSASTSNGIAQFAFGFYSIMLTSTILGIILLVLYKPRSWCVICPMGTLTQGICTLKNYKSQ